jgi:hypothetical protein
MYRDTWMSPLDVSLFPFEKKTEKKGNDRVSPAATDSVIKKKIPQTKQNENMYVYISRTTEWQFFLLYNRETGAAVRLSIQRSCRCIGRRWPPQVKTNICVSYRRRQDEEGAVLSGRVTSENIERDISPPPLCDLIAPFTSNWPTLFLPWFESTFLCSLYANIDWPATDTTTHTHTPYVILCKAYIAVSLCVSPSDLSLSVFICKIHRQRERESTWTSLNQHGHFSLILEVRLHRERETFQIDPTCYTEVMMTSKV